MVDKSAPAGIAVKVYNNNINQALSTLKRKINDDGLKKEMRKREFHETKSQKRRKDKAAAIRRSQKQLSDAKKEGLVW
jgi:small subunit ribosomal protein S21